ncbi:MAG TPA: glycosyltransferase family 2 protein [Bacteroidales bacterium]|nr:glycosyltransferase family 2 protein [Bacteroidales bacterium]HCI56119.1 glycosyltransferase family 2 protein [Bacteroidales bacterium]HOU95174.1 glycosyltransferase family 2 protein [Bacteroidales bacterium]HQG35941.1 glycosyltransferase family 2 protein [Bacteroidales bacterium]HQG53654.1 glycosyltransferase family 2 protein [Bacteroidales bacterium]
MVKISAVIIAYNEEDFIERCLESIDGIADEIIVVDSFSTDSTPEKCKKYNVRFFQHAFEGYAEQKNYATSLASYPHVLSLDADEALSEELKKSILEVKENFKYDGYLFNRRNNYCGKWMKHSRLYPDRQLRLFDMRKGKWEGPNPHDSFKLASGYRVVRLKGDIYHWYYKSIQEHVDKLNRFSTIAAEEYFKEGKKAGVYTGYLHRVWNFFRSYILSAGFLDGYLGYLYCSISAYGSFLKYSKLRRLGMLNKK